MHRIAFRYLDQKEKNLQEAHRKIQVLERDIAEKDSEVKFCDRLQLCLVKLVQIFSMGFEVVRFILCVSIDNPIQGTYF